MKVPRKIAAAIRYLINLDLSCMSIF